jgi:hypothetical protein
LAPALNVLHCPSGDSIPDLLCDTNIVGVSSAFTPPTRADSHSPFARSRIALCNATRLLEHAVSTASLLPCKLKRNDTRLTRIECTVPVEIYGAISCRLSRINSL